VTAIARFHAIESRGIVMPALVAGIHAFLAGFSASKTWVAGTSPAMTLEKGFLIAVRSALAIV